MDNPIVSLTAACRLCRCEQKITAPVSGWLAWQNGELIQEALPMLSPSERELLISGTCDDCWTEMFGEPEDEFEENFINN
tara:strand:+ start:343 stop:582 length:240 start_codon:yes stop_codon:yes gene_type:complete